MPSIKIKILNEPKELPAQLDKNISITAWNIGYAGLGEKSDFIMDGGKSYLPPSRAEVKSNLFGIKETLLSLNSDVFLLQEVSNKSPLSFLVPVRSEIVALFPNFLAIFRADIASRGLPWPLRVCHGTLSLAKAKLTSSNVITLPHEPTLLAGLLRRRYGLLVSRFAIKNNDKPIEKNNKQWVIANLHLAAFDEKGATRQKQFDAVFAFAKQEYKKGNYVVLGGDWNMELTKTTFTHKTPKKHLFWRIGFPLDRLPKGWKIGVDENVPSVRTMHKPYVRGENYTSIIDGFIVSPNVKIKKIKTLDTGFKNTDHLPVSGNFSTK